MAKKQATRKSSREVSSINLTRHMREALFIIIGAIALFLLLSLGTYHDTDPGWSNTGDNVTTIMNAGGRAGAWVSDLLLYLFGYMAYLMPFILVYCTWLLIRTKNAPESTMSTLWTSTLQFGGFLLLMLGGSGVASLQLAQFHAHLPFTAGGILGTLVGPGLAMNFNLIGATLLLVAMLCTGMTLATGLSWFWLMDIVGRWGINSMKVVHHALVKLKPSWNGKKTERKEPLVKNRSDRIESEPALKIDIRSEPVISSIEPREPKLATKGTAGQMPSVTAVAQPPSSPPVIKPRSIGSKPMGDVPSLDLLDPPEPKSKKGYSTAKLEEMSREVEAKLKDFGIHVQVVAVHPGPVITRFEMQLAPGIKVSRISTLAKDLARSLSVTSVRIVDVIPGKSVVGLELPNDDREMVRLSEILSSQQYEQMRSPLALALGKDIAGHPVIVDLAKMPHLLVAGTTGSGKSVGLNAMLLGLLYKSTPADVRMILVDPKMLELSIYQGIPHLLTPVVTDMKEAANALRWCVAEMDRRYRLMAALGVRNLAGYNNKVKDAEKNGAPISDPIWRGPPGEPSPLLQCLPCIVVVIDEYADMMMVVGKKVEQLIARIAQKARAAGIHLILATQRPSVDVITGLIKANIPTRIAFQVSSKIDSRTVLDQGGAEQLLGNGDMLYLPPGTSVPVRVHGAFVADHEVH